MVWMEMGGFGLYVTYVILCAYVTILMVCLSLTYWVVLACNLNLVNSMLIIYESSIGEFLLTVLYLIYLVITFTCYLFPTLADYQL
jgi:hypothetical protein